MYIPPFKAEDFDKLLTNEAMWPGAEDIRNWIYGEVLPAIRVSGGYRLAA